MPRDVVEISLDEIGIICNTDAREQGEGAVVIKQSDTKEVLKRTTNYAVYSKNVDPGAPKGRLQPIKGLGQTTSAPDLVDLDGESIVKSDWIAKPDGTYTLISDDGTNIRYTEDFYDSTSPALTPTTVVTGVDMACSTANNQELHIGTGHTTSTPPKWVGYVNHNPFGGIGAVTKTSGINVMFAGGDYTGTTDAEYHIKITSTGTPDKFEWQKGTGAWSAEIDIVVTGEQTIAEGVTVWFNMSTGYTVGDAWTIMVYAKKTVPIAENAECADLMPATASIYNQFALTVTGGGTGTNWKSTIKYRFKLSFDYDGYQESPLSEQYVDLTAADYEYVDVKIIAYQASSLVYSYNKRLTAVNIYLAESVDAEASGLEGFKLMQKVPLVSSAFSLTAAYYAAYNYGWALPYLNMNLGNFALKFVSSIAGNSASTGADKVMQGYKIYSPTIKGALYSQVTGRADSLKNTILNYSLSCQTNGYHFVAKAYHAEIKEIANQMLFRSDLGCYDCFNWSTNFLNLPFVPLQIAAFQSKIYVFGDNKILRVNPDLFIEETYQGVGIAANLVPLVTDSAIYWFDKNSVYMFDGKQILDIGIPIKGSYDSSFKSFANTIGTGDTSPIIVYSAEKKCIVFTYSTTIAHNMLLTAWAWSLDKLEWYYWELFTSYDPSNYYLFNGKYGEIYFSDLYTLKTYKFFAHANYLAMEFVTKKYDIGLQNQDKKWYFAKHSGSSSLPTLTYGVNDAAYSALTNSISAAGALSAIQKAKNIQIKIVSSAGSTLYYLDTLELIVRELIGRR